MWPVRGVLRNRWRPVVIALLTVAITVLVAGRWSPSAAGASSGTLTGAGDKLEFYGAARNLPASDSRFAPQRLPASISTSSSSPSSSSSLNGSPGSLSGVPANSAEAKLPDPGLPPAPVFSRYDKEIEKVEEGEQPPLTEEWLKEREKVYEERKKRLRATCEKWHVGVDDSRIVRSILVNGDAKLTPEGPVERIEPEHFTIVPPKKTMVCLVNKVASTSLLGTFLKLTGHGVPVFSNLSSPHSIAKVLRPSKPGQFELAKKQYFKFMFVRHPLERLISAYEDKVVKANHPSLYYLRRSIFAAHEDIYIRHEIYNKLRASLEDEAAILSSYDAQVAKYREEVEARKNIPTFSEFLDFALAREPTGDGFESHWTPYWRQCSPCHIDFDVIGKLETAEDDFKYVWNSMQIYNYVKIPWQNSRRHDRTTLKEQVRRYLSPVPASTMARLRGAFKLDFELFGYDWSSTLRWSGHCRAGETCALD